MNIDLKGLISQSSICLFIIDIDPLVGLTSPDISLIKLLLPEPFGPIIETISPA